MTTQPDAYSNAWYRKQITGLSQAMNCYMADVSEAQNAIAEMRERGVAMRAAIEDIRAELGRQNGEIEELKEAVQKARDAFRELQKSKQ